MKFQKKILANFGKFVPLRQFRFLGNVTVSIQGRIHSKYPNVFSVSFFFKYCVCSFVVITFESLNSH